MHELLQLSHNYIILSDLHLSEGLDPLSRKYSRNEDFLFDEEFAHFLDYLRATRGELPWHLIFNGDLVDFLQVTSTEGAPAEFLDSSNLKYGLDCGEAQSVLKLRRIFQGHPRFFDALARFAASFPVTIVAGNHDIEFFYPAVKAEFISLLEKAGEGAGRIRENVAFQDWFFLHHGLLLVEHGHLYDRLNSFMHALDPRLPRLAGIPDGQADDIDLPLGSVFVRYFFNRIESAYPFSDNIRPSSDFISWLIRKEPLLALRFFLGDGRYLGRRMGEIWKPLPLHAYSARKMEHERAKEELARRLASEWNLDGYSVGQKLDQMCRWHRQSIFRETKGARLRFFYLLVRLGYAALFGLLLLAILLALMGAAFFLRFFILTPLVGFLWITAAVFLIILFLAFSKGPEADHPSPYLEAARRLQQLWGVRYVVMGHTHFCDLQTLDSGHAKYFNTGTWTKVFEATPTSVLPGENELAFLEILCEGKGAPSARLMRWTDGARRPQLVRLFH